MWNPRQNLGAMYQICSSIGECEKLHFAKPWVPSRGPFRATSGSRLTQPFDAADEVIVTGQVLEKDAKAVRFRQGGGAGRWIGTTGRAISILLHGAVPAALMAALVIGSAVRTPAYARPRSLGSPNRLALMPSGHLLVSDHRLKGVAVWNPHREEVVRVIRIPGRAIGVAMGWNRIFVGSENTQSVDVYNPGGKLQYVLGGEDGQVTRPSDIALDIERGLVFVSDSANARVVVYDSLGPLLRTLPAPGEPVRLAQPTGLAVDPVRQEVIVSDYGKAGGFSMRAHVRIYDYNGYLRGTISGSSVAPEFRFSRPQGIAVNGQGLIYVVDSLSGRVLVFDRETLQGVGILGELGTGPGQLTLPLDAVIGGKNGDLYVSSNRAGRVEVFSGGGVLP